MALGAENTSAVATFKWNDSFWVDMYNQAATKFQSISPSKKVEIASDDGSTSSSDDEFDGELEIVKSSKVSITKAIKKDKKSKDKKSKEKKNKKVDNKKKRKVSSSDSDSD